MTSAFEKELAHNSKVHPGYQGIMDLIKQKDKINEHTKLIKEKHL